MHYCLNALSGDWYKFRHIASVLPLCCKTESWRYSAQHTKSVSQAISTPYFLASMTRLFFKNNSVERLSIARNEMHLCATSRAGTVYMISISVFNNGTINASVQYSSNVHNGAQITEIISALDSRSFYVGDDRGVVSQCKCVSVCIFCTHDERQNAAFFRREISSFAYQQKCSSKATRKSCSWTYAMAIGWPCRR